MLLVFDFLSTNFKKIEFQCYFSDFLYFVLQIQTYSPKLGKNFIVLSAKTKLYKNVSLTAKELSKELSKSRVIEISVVRKPDDFKKEICIECTN